MPGRYTEAQRQSIMANRRARDAGLAYGYDYADQGYSGAKENGQAAYNLAKSFAQFGRFSDPTRDQRIGPDGQVQWRSNASTPDRLATTGGDWQDAPDYVQRGYKNSRGVEQFGAPSADAWQKYAMQKGLQQQIGSGAVKAGGDGRFYNASGAAYDAGGHHLSDAYVNTGLAGTLFGGTGRMPTGSEGAGGISGAPMTPVPGTTVPEPVSNVPKIGDLNMQSVNGQQPVDDMLDPTKKKKTLGNLAFGGATGSLGSDF